MAEVTQITKEALAVIRSRLCDGRLNVPDRHDDFKYDDLKITKEVIDDFEQKCIEPARRHIRRCRFKSDADLNGRMVTPT